MMNYFQKKKLAFMSIANRVKGFIRTITGVFPLTLTNCVDGKSITDYTIYGNSIQNGTPKPDSPIEVESVGEYDEATGKYKIPITISAGTRNIKTNIYLDEPLRKVGDYADYIDFENGKVVRNVDKYTFTGNETDMGGATNDPNSFGYVVKLSSLSLSNKKAGLCNCLRQGVVDRSGTNRFAYHNIANHPFVYVFFKKTDFPELGTYSPSTAKQVVKEMYDSGVPMVLYYNRNTPTETSITLPNLPTFKGTSIISADTTTQPSNAEIEYYSNVKE